jgi:hypothetical protein
MNRYRCYWWRGWCFLCFALTCLACVVWRYVVIGVWVSVVGASLVLSVACYRAAEHPVTFRRAARFGLLAGGILATALVAFLPLAAVNGGLAVVVVVLAGLTSPWCLVRVGRFMRAGRGSSWTEIPPEDRPVGLSPTSQYSGMTDASLCQAWRASFAELVGVVDPTDRARVVRLRQDHLDELLRRHPEPVRAWLATGPRAAGGPERFLQAPHQRAATPHEKPTITDQDRRRQR